MDERDVAAVEADLGLEALARVAADGPPVLFATVSGAHLYGFASPDSDVDLRGAYVLPAEAMLGLSRPEETRSATPTVDGRLVDWVAHDVRKFARMMLRANGYVLEQVLSPLVVAGGAAFEELRHLARGCVTRGIYRHYLGFAEGRRSLLDAPDATVKHLLYAYRVYLTGRHALRTGEVESNLPALLALDPHPEVDSLLGRKREGGEAMRLREGEAARHEGALDRLAEELEDAVDGSALPLEPTVRAAMEDFVLRVRGLRPGSARGA